jgi:hypothetical protein
MDARLQKYCAQITHGRFRAHDARRWLRTIAPESIKAHVREGVSNGLKLEWCLLTAALEIPPDPGQWDHVKARRTKAGWSLHITVDGVTHVMGE